MTSPLCSNLPVRGWYLRRDDPIWLAGDWLHKNEKSKSVFKFIVNERQVRVSRFPCLWICMPPSQWFNFGLLISRNLFQHMQPNWNWMTCTGEGGLLCNGMKLCVNQQMNYPVFLCFIGESNKSRVYWIRILRVLSEFFISLVAELQALKQHFAVTVRYRSVAWVIY